MLKNNYYIGLDVGTSSVGWAVTDLNYELINVRGRAFWGSYLFDAAETAVKTRGFRSARRRIAKRVFRIKLLQELFQNEIEKVDPLFFLRLKESKLFFEDKDEKIKTKNVLFDDAAFGDKEFFSRYKTVFHLRKALITEKCSDIRLLYLAIHHIIKNRGHFLFENQEFGLSGGVEIVSNFREVNTILSELDESGFELENISSAIDVLKNDKMGKRDKQKMLQSIFNAKNNKILCAAICAIVGGTVKTKELFPTFEELSIEKFTFDSADFVELLLPKLEEDVGADNARLVGKLKTIYDWTILNEIMSGYTYISEAKVAIYDKHKADLKRLKAYVRKNGNRDLYRKTFRYIDKENNYAAYIGMDKQKGNHKCTKDEFYAFLKKTVKIDDEAMLKEINEGTFLPKQIASINGNIPYQVHLAELKAILKNAENYFPFLSQKSDGVSVAEKIAMLMTFKVPYYVGPLNTLSRFHWVVKNEGYNNARITPWNFDKAINKDASENRFIENMTAKCTYLIGEKVLPESSLIYSEFAFLNELNNLRVNGEKNKEVKTLVYEYAKQHKKITLKKVLVLLKTKGLVNANATTDVFSGTDGDFKKSLSSYIDLKNILGDFVDSHSEICENIIRWITLVSDKNRLAARIKKEYGKLISDEDIKKLKGLNYTKWGRLSYKLLKEIYSPNCVDENGAALSIVDKLRVDNDNFQQLLSDKYGYKQAIADQNCEFEVDGNITYKTVVDEYASPSVKRAIWRALVLVREIEKVMGGAPKKIFVETARDVADNGKKGKRTISRKQQLIDLYRSIKSDDIGAWLKEIEMTADTKFNSDKLVLYYRQMGKSMYSGKTIRIEDVFNTNICDIEHIYPQSKIKDDSLNNKVLVFKIENAVKSDNYPLAQSIREKMNPFWIELKNKGLITEEKLYRLTRTTALTQDELTDFINRQLVETRQSTKIICKLLANAFPNTEIVYAKAANADKFKQKNGIAKVRELNDLHHAKDAYINIVVGNVYNTKFGHNAAIYFKNHNVDSYNIEHLFDKDISGCWTVADKEKILLTAERNDCFVARMSGEYDGALFDATIYPAGKNNALIPLKANGAISDTTKYGGYDSAKTAYFMLVQSENKNGEKLLSLERVTVLLTKTKGFGKEMLIDYCKNKLLLVNPKIVINKIKINSLFSINGSLAYIRGATGNQIAWCNAVQLYLDKAQTSYLKNISNYYKDKAKYKKPDLEISDNYKITAEQNLCLYDALLSKLHTHKFEGLLSLKTQITFLLSAKERFAVLSIKEQCEVIMQILHLAECKPTCADFTLLGAKGRNSGNVRTNKFINDKKMKIIYCSPTGYYRKVVDLKTYL